MDIGIVPRCSTFVLTDTLIMGQFYYESRADDPQHPERCGLAAGGPPS